MVAGMDPPAELQLATPKGRAAPHSDNMLTKFILVLVSCLKDL